jgi:DNA polymerase-1
MATAHRPGVQYRRGFIIRRPKTIKSELKRVGGIREREANAALAMVPHDVCENLKSGQQLGRALHEFFELPVLYRTDSGLPSTDAATLAELRKRLNKRAKAYKFISHVLKAAQAKTAETYITNYAEHSIVVNGVTYLFPSINPTGTATTRVSGSNPNPQNVGKGKEVDEETKEVDYKLRINFGPNKGRVWYALDYDQLQLRIFAKASGDERMVKAFADGYDFHTWMGCEIFQVAPDQLTKLQRRIAKNVNFGYIFGAGPRRIEETSGMKGLSDKLNKMFPIVTEYMKTTIDYVRRHGHVYTLGGYRLAVEKSKAYSGVCIVVQGTEGEIVKDAMVRVHDEVKHFGKDFYMTLMVHDEMVFDASKDMDEDHKSILRRIKRCMEAASLAVGVTTVANCEINRKNWAEFEKVKL